MAPALAEILIKLAGVIFVLSIVGTVSAPFFTEEGRKRQRDWATLRDPFGTGLYEYGVVLIIGCCVAGLVYIAGLALR